MKISEQNKNNAKAGAAFAVGILAVCAVYDIGKAAVGFAGRKISEHKEKKAAKMAASTPAPAPAQPQVVVDQMPQEVKSDGSAEP